VISDAFNNKSVHFVEAIISFVLSVRMEQLSFPLDGYFMKFDI
jgi:hypothetical protein